MEQGTKSAKAKVEVRPTAIRKSRKIDGSTDPQFKQRLAEALEQHAAVSEILRVISTSPGDVKPVLNAVADRALKLCDAADATIFLVEGDKLRTAARFGSMSVYSPLGSFMPLTRGSVSGRAVIDRAVIDMEDLATAAEEEFPLARELQRRVGHRAILSVPLMREDGAIGAITLWRTEARRFTDNQITLVKTFADQAAIAIENVRLFDEVQAHARELSVSLQQQTATADVLKVISRSAFDLQTVLDTLTESACKLCEAETSTVWRPDGDGFKVAAMFGQSPTHEAAIKQRVVKPGRDTCVARTLLEGRTVQIHDAEADPEYNVPDFLTADGNRALVGVPLVRDGAPIGVLVLTRSVARPFTERQIALATTFADQAVIAIENVRLFKEMQEALEQQIATSEILRVISQSPTDVQPVFDTIAAAALKLCAASSVTVFTFDGELIRIAALVNVSPEGAHAVRGFYPRPPGRDNAASRAVLTCSVITIPDVLEDREIAYRDTPVASAFRSVLAVPLMRDGSPIGAISVGRLEPGPFPDKQIVLLQTFADQAVIAIENVRLFNETNEALEQQTATSDILRVISQSPTDVQPVFDTIVEAALRLCEATSANVVTFDGELIHLAAFGPAFPEGVDIALHHTYPRPPSRDTANARAVLTRSVVVIPDVLEDRDYAIGARAVATGYRSVLSVPLMREGGPTGAITVARPNPGSFPEKQITLLRTFADQAVIAIENVRLFTELTHKNRALTQAHAQVSEALDRQTATSEILRVISSSPTDVQPVFDTIVANAARVCSAESAAVYRFDGEVVDFVAGYHFSPEALEAYRHRFPCSLRETDYLQRVVDGSVLNISDIENDPHTTRRTGDLYRARGARSSIFVPMVREARAIGAIGVSHREVGAFSDERVELLKTFADQAVIAIENVHLFTELEARTTQLTRSVGELKALGEVGQAVSSTLDLETVLSTIVSRATQLAGMDGGSIWEYDETREEFYLRAADRLSDELVEALRAAPIRKGEGALGRLAMTGEPVEIRDIVDEGSYQSRVRDILIRCGYRSVLAVPLLREDHLLGALAVNRNSRGAFASEVIDLLKTFATQSALAIQNARLFRQIEEKSRELETASRHKSEFLANMSHELRTPLNAIIGFSDVLSQRMFGEINDKQAEYLADILESGQHLLSLINDILDLSKIEAGRMELEPTEFNLPTTIENTLILVRERAQRHGITLGHTVDERLGTIRGDERKVKQVLLNLLSNALKFTPEGGQIDVRAELRDGTAEISVRDTGVGIAPEDQEAVFEEFRQVGIASKKVEGTGLGLAISRKFIELHGGRIWVESQEGKGSTFAFTLPLSIDQHDQPANGRL